MFNPLHVVLKEDNISYIQESALTSFRDFYNDRLLNLSNAVANSHRIFTDFRKNMIEKFHGKKFHKEVSTSQLLCRKVEIFYNTICDSLKNNVSEDSKFILKHNKNTRDQLYILKNIFSKPNDVMKHRVYYSNGIGFRTLELPTKEEYIKAIYYHTDAYRKEYPIYEDILYSKFDKCYRTTEALSNEMYKSINFYFEEGKGYTAKEYVDIFDAMNRDMVNMLAEHKEKYAQIRSYINAVNKQCTEEYNSYLHEIDMLIKDKRDKEHRLALVTHNYKVLNAFLISLVDMVSIYHKIQLKILLMSYENYMDMINFIYDDNMG